MPAAAAWAEPLFTVGVTGTNGKTSTVHLIAAIVGAAGERVFSRSTVEDRLDGEVLPRDETRAARMALIQRAAEQGCRRLVLEVTSRALARGLARTWRFDLGVFTNLSPDHLDTHGSWEGYLAAKAQLFVHLGPGRHAVLDAGDPHVPLLERAIPPDVRISRYAAAWRPASGAVDLLARAVELDPSGTSIVLEPAAVADELGPAPLRTRLIGKPFAQNALAAALAAHRAGFSGAAIRRGLETCPMVSGRFEVVSRDPLVVVDYAHTPDALTATLGTARDLARGRVIVVFGAGGSRMTEKRGPMGEVVGRLADLAVITSDNPRREAPEAIAAAVLAGCRRGTAKAEVVLDRAEAIARALDHAGAGDVVLVAGKGHETRQQLADRHVPFSDAQVVRALLAGRSP